jgi:hypothetical protein
MKMITFHDKFFILVVAFGGMLCARDVLAVGRQDEFKQIQELEQSLKEEAPVELVQRPNLEYKSQDTRDPFRSVFDQEADPQAGGSGGPGQPAQGTPPSLSVQGIIWGTSLPQAIVSGKVVKVGDTIEGAKITGIDKSGVSVIFQDMEHMLPAPGAKESSKKSQGG